MMQKPGKPLAWLGAGLVGLLVGFLVVRTWIVPAVIAGQVRGILGGQVEIRDWWLNGHSAGVVGLVAREGAGQAPWLSAGRVTTDLSLGGLIRGRFSPGKVTLESPEVSLKFDARGNLLTEIGGTSAESSPAMIPIVIAQGATLRLQQQGRPAMVVSGVTARIGPDHEQVILSARSNDPTWGPFEALGSFERSLHTGAVKLQTKRSVKVSPEMVKAIPFVPADVWQNVAPSGLVDVTLKAKLRHGVPHVQTEITLRGTEVHSATLDLTASDATGRIVVDDSEVTFEKVSGRALDGRVTGAGQADFTSTPALFDLNLDLKTINIADAPKSWQLDEAEVTGLLTGKVQLKAQLKPDGVDLSGTSGQAVVEKGTIQGIPFTSLKLAMSARGNDLRYETPKEQALRWQIGRPLALLTLLSTVGFQPPAQPAASARPAIKLPESLTTHLELQDVELSQLIAKAKYLLGYPFPVPISGRLSLKADATIPLGKNRSLAEYAFHGDLRLTKTSIDKVDLGRVSARIDVQDGIVELKNLRGRLIDRPDGGPDNPPQVEGAEVPETGPLPPGAFRGSLFAMFSPPGKLTAQFEGNRLPLGELAAPALPRPTPLAGLATLDLQAQADLSAASDPAGWSASGTGESQEIRYKGAALDRVKVKFGLKNGQLEVSELTALLRDRPLRARVNFDLKPPRTFQGIVDVAGWDIAEILAWVPGTPRPAPVAGSLSARAEASGTLEPFQVKTDGHGSFERFQAGPVALGTMPFQWTTQGDSVALKVTDAHPFGGRVTAEASVPLTGGRPIEGSATVVGIVTAARSASIPNGSLKLSGRAGGKVTFTIPADVKRLDADVQLAAPDLTVQGIPAEKVKATVGAHNGKLAYEVWAESLGGILRLNGDFPLGSNSPSNDKPNFADGELRAVGFLLDRVWKTLGISGAVLRLTGRGAIDANLRAVLGGPMSGLYAHGIAELRDLRWSDSPALGRLRGIVVILPDAWRVEPISGDLLGGVVSGLLWGSGLESVDPAGPRRQVGFNLRLDRAPLPIVAELAPALRSVKLQGFATLRAAGTIGEDLRASAELDLPRARIAGLVLTELKVPATLTTTAGSGSAVLQVRRYTARLVGGLVHGDALFHLGTDHRFQTEMKLTGVDLELISRIGSDSNRPPSGKISGKVSLLGSDPLVTRSYRGKVNLTLDDASLISIPIFRELDRFLGSARGGLFEAGDVSGTIANRRLNIDSATLQGRLAQLHITGSIGFDTQVNLEVLVNTNQIIPETGAALVGVIPGLRDVVGRNRDAELQVANYLSNKLLKFRVTGTLKNPSVNLDPGIAVAQSAVGFFTGVLKLPLGMVK